MFHVLHRVDMCTYYAKQKINLACPNKPLSMALDGKSLQKYPVNARAPQGSILGLTLFLLYINDLPDDVICNIAIYANDSSIYSKCDQASDLWQLLELASELESDLRFWTRAGSGL